MRVLSYDDLKAKGIRFSRQWIIKLIAAGKFPQSISLGEQSVGFIESEIDAWINDRIRERDQKSATGTEIKRAVARVGCNPDGSPPIAPNEAEATKGAAGARNRRGAP